MKKNILVGLVLMLVAMDFLSAQQNILFIGNSLTSSQDMPKIFEKIVLKKGRTCYVEAYTEDNKGLVDHARSANLYAKIRGQKWDAVVFQPDTNEVALAKNRAVIEACRRMADSVDKYSPCAQKYIYQIPCQIQGWVVDAYHLYQTLQGKFIANSYSVAKTLGYQVIPVGTAFKGYYHNHLDLLLHAAYAEIYPSATGAYLMACTIYATIYHDANAEHAYYNGLDKKVALQMQSIADKLVLGKVRKKNHQNLVADFMVTDLGNHRYHLKNLSHNSDRVSWDFGKGDPSEADEFDLQLERPLTSVSLTAYKGTCSRRKMQNMSLSSALYTHDIEAKPLLKIYPNPVQDVLYIRDLPEKAIEIKILDLEGKVWHQETCRSPLATVNVSHLAKGNYLLILGDKLHKFIKE